MSFETNDVSVNNEKKPLEIFDVPMVSDNCFDNDVEMTYDQSITDEVPVAVNKEFPPKYDKCSTFLKALEFPKRKKSKLRFDQLLYNLHPNCMGTILTKLLHFLESNNKEITFPFVVKENEEFFEMIVQDINLLKSKSLDADYRDICDKIIAASTGHLLTCDYEYRQDFQKIVMVIKKENDMMDQSENGTHSLSCSTDSVLPSSRTSSEVDITEAKSRSPSLGPISNDFTLHCLRTALAFIKNDVTDKEEFSELNLEQAHFVQLLLESVITFTGFDNNLEIKDSYRSLWEAVRIYRLKYEFRIKCEESWSGNKNLLFEKVPINIRSLTSANSNGIMDSKIDVEKPASPKPEVPKPVPSEQEQCSMSKPWFPISVIPKSSHINPNPTTSITKRMLTRQLKKENQILLIKRLPSEFISDTLDIIRNFLLNEASSILVLVPKTHTELDFYRNCLDWCQNTYDVSKFGDEFQDMHYQVFCLLLRVNCTVNQVNSNKENESTGMKEVCYIKEEKQDPVGTIPEPAETQSAPKKKKLNIEHAIQLAETNNIKLETVINLNQSLRNKKKNKKQRKAILKATSMEAAIKPKNQSKAWADYSSSNCSSRSTSRERYNKVTEAQNVANRSLSEINQMSINSLQERPRRRRGEALIRKEQLKEAMSVPVQIDKAMRMMRGMGWSGGALGARGNGITEPLMPSLDLPRGAGLGHSRNKYSETFAKKPAKSKTAPAFVSQNPSSSPETSKMETDVIVQKTKQLLRENTTFDTIMKTTESNVELTKSTQLNAKQQLQPPRNLPKFSKGLLNPENWQALPSFRHRILQSILELLSTEALFKTMTNENKICKKKRKFVRQAFMLLDSTRITGLIQKDELDIFREIQNKYRELPGVSFETLYSSDGKTIQIKKKMPPDFKAPSQQEVSKQVNKEASTVNTEKVTEEIKKDMLLEVKAPTQQDVFNQVNKEASAVNTETITEETVHSYIISSGTIYQGKQPGLLKFKVLILLNIIGFLKSLKEEVEITFNKILNPKQRTYIENVIDEVNMRIKFGSTPVESQLCAEIKTHVKDAFLSSMFNHQYTIVTLNKHFRFKRLNRPDNVVKRTCQTTVDLDAFTSETISPSKLSTNNSTVKENNNEDTENNSDYVAFKNNLNVTEHSHKKSIGDWNIVMDNDSKDIDIKRECGNTKRTEENNIFDTEAVNYVVCVDYTEVVNDSEEVTVDINKEKEVVVTELKKVEETHQAMKQAKIVIANDVEMANQHREIIGIDNTDRMIDEGLSKTEDTINGNVMVTEDFDSNDCNETVIKDVVQNNAYTSMNEKDISKDIEVYDEPMDEIIITEKSKVLIDKEDSVKEINKKESEELMNKGESMEEINNIETSTDVEVANMEEDNSINSSDDQIVNGDLEMKTDNTDLISKEKLVLSEEFCDTLSVELSHIKTMGTEIKEPENHISKDTEIKTVYIVHANHPIEELTNDNIKEIQKHISNSIFLATQLPLLKCHGVQNGALIYSCLNKNTYDWLQNTVSIASYVKVLNATEITKMSLRFHCFFDFDIKDLFNMIEWYNQKLSTKDWEVEKIEKDGDTLNLIVKMDKFSVKFIQDLDLSLFGGIDKILFTPIWE